MILVDSREKKWSNIEDYFQRHDIPYKVTKLDEGDYMLAGVDGITIDRKRNIDECCTNLCSNDSSRFWREVRRAKKKNMRFIVLVEHGSNYKSIKDVTKWKSRYTKVPGKWVAEEMYRCHIAYGVEWIFCSKGSTGKIIVELLGQYKSKGGGGCVK